MTLTVREVNPDPISVVNMAIAPHGRIASVRDFGVENPVGPFGDGLHEVFIDDVDQAGTIVAVLLSAGFEIHGGAS